MRTRVRQLAKLRQFVKGMDVESYLLGEYRQNLLALERLFIKDGGSSSDQSGSQLFGSADLYAQRIASFNIGPVDITDRVLNSGRVSGQVFFPEVEGTYWIEYGCQFTPGVAGPVTNRLIAKNQAGVAFHTMIRSVASSTGVVYVSGRFKTTLSPSIGVYFDFTGDANTIGFNFNCSVERIK